MSRDTFISASAGTGKTHAISKAYVDLFDQAFQRGEPLDVGNVVAITFTRKAAAEMKSRILDMMSERSNEAEWNRLRSYMAYAWISTIDSFAQRILSEVGIYAQVDPGLSIGTESMIEGILERCMARSFVEYEELLVPMLRYYTIDEIGEALRLAILRWRCSMMRARPAGPFEGGLPLHGNPEVADGLALASKAFKTLFDKVYGLLIEELKEENLTDFTGVLLLLREILSSPDNAWIRDRYSSQFRHIIVDEFQDTNSLQKEILDLLRGEETRVIYVGDAKQSIYRFRGAEVEVFSQAMGEVGSNGGEIQYLDRNYRSHPDILAFCNLFYSAVFCGGASSCCQSYEPVGPLSVVGETECRPRVKVLYDPEDEAEAAARYILGLVGSEFDFLERRRDGEGVKLHLHRRLVQFKDIAILLRKIRPDIGKQYMQALSRHEIPYYTVGELGFYDMPELAGILAALKVLSNPGDDLSLTDVLVSPLVGLDIEEMARLKFRAKACGSSIYEALGHIEAGDICPGRIEGARRFQRMIDRYIPIRALIRPSQLIERIMEELDYPAFLATKDKSGRKSANLRKFVIAARGFDEAGASLRELIRLLLDAGLGDEEQASIESEDTDAVKIMTVHKAKGLEFPIVILGETSWNKNMQRDPLIFNDDGGCILFSLYLKDEGEGETLLSRWMQEEQEREQWEEKRSLYVATTRASDMLVMTFSKKGGRGTKPWREMLQGVLIEGEDEVGLATGFEDVLEVVGANAPAPPATPTSSKSRRIECMYITPVNYLPFKEYVSPTAIVESQGLGRALPSGGKEDGDGGLRGDRGRTLGLLAHGILERLGEGCLLEELAEGQDSWISQWDEDLREDEVQEVWSYLDRLRDHPLIGMIEEAAESFSEYALAKPLGRFILYGRLDKLIRTEDGWKIVDFKFAESKSHSEAYEFQMRFYLYLAREIFKPMLDAEIFYLKDGVVRGVGMGDEDVEEFERELIGRVEEYQRDILWLPG